MKSFILKKIFLRKSKNPTDETYEFKRSDYDNTFTIPRNVLRYVSIRMTHKLTPFASNCWDLFYWFEFWGTLVGLTAEIISAILTAKGGSFQDAVKIFRMLPCMGMVFLAISKSYTIVVYRPVYENLVNEVGDMWPEGKLDDEEGAIVGNALKQLLFIIKGYYWCNNALLISYLLPPLAEGIKRALGYENEMLLPFFYWMPFDVFQPVYIDVMLLIQTWQATVVVLGNLCGDLLFCAFLSHITTQFDLLSLRIRRLVHVPIDSQLIGSYPLGVFYKEFSQFQNYSNNNMDNFDWEKKHQKELVQIIARHETLIRLSGDVERMFSFSLLVTFFNSSIIICFCGFCCILVEEWNEIAYKSFLLTALSETYLICWYGQKLLDSSTGVSQALYNSGWYMASKNIKSSILIMLHRAQKEVCVTTYGFSVISSESYTKIIKTAWSYFTLLINIYT